MRNDDYAYRMPASQALLKWTDEKFDPAPFLKASRPAPVHLTAHGALFGSDCMKSPADFIKDGVVDTIFADPPFNLAKEYGKNCDDSLSRTTATSRGAGNGWPSACAS